MFPFAITLAVEVLRTVVLQWTEIVGNIVVIDRMVGGKIDIEEKVE